MEIYRSLTPSMGGVFFRLSYELHVEVRHDIMFEKGMNYKIVTEPIIVFAHPFDPTLFSPDLSINNPAAWEPVNQGCCA